MKSQPRIVFSPQLYIILLVNLISKHKTPLFLSVSYFLFRLVNLTKLPIFNDEAIYLDWGFRETHVPGYLYYSLYDSKQPFLMWVFGIFQTILPDPLFAGRLVLVIFGFLTLAGIYKICKQYFDKKIAIIASISYILVPIFVFYDRQALMESSIGAIGIWSVYYLLKVIDEKKYKDSVFLGVTLGIGFFIKSSAAIFIISAILILVFYILRGRQKVLYFKNLLVASISFFLVDLLLFLNPQFWQTLPSNNRFVFTFSDLLSFPINTWFNNLIGNFEIGFIYITPLVFLAGAIGIYFAGRENTRDKKILAAWTLLSILIQIILIKGTSQRYLVSFLPPFIIFAAYGLVEIYKKIKLNNDSFFAIPLFIPLFLSVFLISNPIQYIQFTSKLSGYSLLEYVNGQTSGIGVLETVDFLKKRINGNKALVGIALNTGNPESAMINYFQKSNNIKVTYLDSQLFSESLNEIKCLEYKDPVYFVSRDEQQGGLNKYFSFLKRFKNPYSDYSVGVYKLSENCSGKTFVIPDI